MTTSGVLNLLVKNWLARNGYEMKDVYITSEFVTKQLVLGGLPNGTIRQETPGCVTFIYEIEINGDTNLPPNAIVSVNSSNKFHRYTEWNPGALPQATAIPVMACEEFFELDVENKMLLPGVINLGVYVLYLKVTPLHKSINQPPHLY